MWQKTNPLTQPAHELTNIAASLIREDASGNTGKEKRCSAP
jgi:hypothetical protein